MKKDKDIEKIFREGFDKMEHAPSSRVWENVRHELDKKKERKVIPLWIRLGGIAALIAVLFTIGSVFWNTDDPTFIEPPITAAPEIEIEKNTFFDSSNASSETQHTEIASDKDNVIVNDDSESTVNESLTDNNSIATQSQPSSSKKSSTVIKNQEKTSITKNTQSEKQFNIAENDTQTIIKPLDTAEVIAKSDSTEFENLEKVIPKIQENKASIFDAIAENDKTEESDEKDKNPKRWQVTPNVAPVYYNSIGGGSSIDPSFSQSPVQGDINMSYGVQVSYAVSNRLNIRTGISAVDLQYSTGDIIPATGPASRGLKGVNYHSNTTVITAIPRLGTNTGELNLKSGTSDARLVQSINYVEVPLEVSYAILNDRFGLNLIGGMSTLFLGENDIAIQSQEFNTSLGSANNLSSLSFSTNIGLGINYQLSSRFNFSLEPMFKYQLNPYSDSSVNFKPYYMGIYSGLSFRF